MTDEDKFRKELREKLGMPEPKPHRELTWAAIRAAFSPNVTVAEAQLFELAAYAPPKGSKPQ